MSREVDIAQPGAALLYLRQKALQLRIRNHPILEPGFQRCLKGNVPHAFSRRIGFEYRPHLPFLIRARFSLSAISRTWDGPGIPLSSAAFASPQPPPRRSSDMSSSDRLLIERASSPA